MVSWNQFCTVLDWIPEHKVYKEPRIKLFKNVKRPTISHITFYLEEDDHIAVAFNGETISFTCQLFKI